MPSHEKLQFFHNTICLPQLAYKFLNIIWKLYINVGVKYLNMYVITYLFGITDKVQTFISTSNDIYTDPTI